MKIDIKLEEIYKLRDVFYKIHYASKLYVWWLYDEQVLMSNWMINQFVSWHLGNKKQDIYINVSRQFWKSFLVFSMIWFFMIFLSRILKKPITIWITVNKKDQVKKNYEEVRWYLQEILPFYNLEFTENTKDSLKISNWSKIVIFSMEAKHNEWETLDFSLVDEAQELNDSKYEKEIFPMLSRTGWVGCYVWVGWFYKNSYYYALQKESNLIFKYDSNYLAWVVNKRYQDTNDHRHLLYLQSLAEAKEKLSATAFKTQYELAWEVWVWEFINLESLKEMKLEEKIDFSKLHHLSVWIDWAKTWDSTVVTVSWLYDSKITVLDFFRIEEPWVSYVDQVKRIISFFEKSWYLPLIDTIYTDSTWVGKAVVDILRDKLKNVEIEEITFWEKTKDQMWTNFLNLFESDNLQYTSSNEKDVKAFEKEMFHLEKRYNKKWQLSFSHPEKGWIHDDYVDSCFLSLLFNEKWSSSFYQMR